MAGKENFNPEKNKAVDPYTRNNDVKNQNLIEDPYKQTPEEKKALEAANKELDETAKKYINTALDTNDRARILSLANNDYERAKSYMPLMAEGYSPEKVAQLLPMAKELGITDIASYLRGTPIPDAEKLLLSDKKNLIEPAIKVAQSVGLSPDRYTVLELDNAMSRTENKITEPRLQLLVSLGYKSDSLLSLIRNREFAWHNLEKAIATPEMKKYLTPEYASFLNEFVAMGADRFKAVHNALRESPAFKNNSDETLFAAAINNYSQEGTRAGNLLSEKMNTLTQELGGLITPDDALKIAVRAPDYDATDLVSFMKDISAQLPDFFKATKDFAHVNMLNVFALSRQDGNMQETVRNIKQLVSKGFSPEQICQLALARKNTLAVKRGTPSLTVLVNDVLAYRTTHKDASLESVIASFNTVYAGGNDYLKLDAQQHGRGDVPAGFAEKLNADPRFAAVLLRDPTYVERLYAAHTSPSDTLAAYTIATRSGIPVQVEELPILLDQLGGPADMVAIIDRLNTTPLVGAQKYNVLSAIGLFKRDPNAIVFIDALQKSGVPPTRWATELTLRRTLSEFTASLSKGSLARN